MNKGTGERVVECAKRMLEGLRGGESCVLSFSNALETRS
jgi:hypothetical protein